MRNFLPTGYGVWMYLSGVIVGWYFRKLMKS